MSARVSCDRVVDMVRTHIDKANYLLDSDGNASGGLQNVCYATGISSKTISDIVNGRRQEVTWQVVERLLIGFNAEHLTWYEPEEGGFKDIFDNLPPEKDYTKYYTYRPKPKDKCPKCGGEKSVPAKTCKACRYTDEASKCKNCQKKLVGGYKRTTGLCRACWDRPEVPKEHQVEYRKGIRRRLGRNVAEV